MTRKLMCLAYKENRQHRKYARFNVFFVIFVIRMYEWVSQNITFTYEY